MLWGEWIQQPCHRLRGHRCSCSHEGKPWGKLRSSPWGLPRTSPQEISTRLPHEAFQHLKPLLCRSRESCLRSMSEMEVIELEACIYSTPYNGDLNGVGMSSTTTTLRASIDIITCMHDLPPSIGVGTTGPITLIMYSKYYMLLSQQLYFSFLFAIFADHPYIWVYLSFTMLWPMEEKKIIMTS